MVKNLQDEFKKITELNPPKGFLKFEQGQELEFYSFIYENYRAKLMYCGEMNEHDSMMGTLLEFYGDEKVREMIYRNPNDSERKTFFEDNWNEDKLKQMRIELHKKDMQSRKIFLKLRRAPAY